DSDDQDARRAESDSEPECERGAEVAAVRSAERQHQAGREDDEPGPEGPHVDELAAGEKQRTDDHAGGREDRARRADQRVEPVCGQPAGEAAAPAEVEDGREKDADSGQDEPEQLRVLVGVSLSGGALLFLYSRGTSRDMLVR